MSSKLPTSLQDKLETLLSNVGDMSLKRRAKRIIEELDPKPNQKIIDLGCGDGYYLYLLTSLSKNFHLIGLDNDRSALSNAKRNLSGKKVKLIQGSVSDMPFSSNSFNKVVFTEVIEHLPDDKLALKEIYRILKKKGTLVLTTTSINYPFFWDPVNWVLQHLLGTYIRNGFWAGIWSGHLRLYKKDHLKKIIIEGGFRIKKIEELTFWCLPFNHHLVNLIARLIYDNYLPSAVADSISKFKGVKKPLVLRLAFLAVNLLDQLNDAFPMQPGVNILVVAKK